MSEMQRDKPRQDTRNDPRVESRDYSRDDPHDNPEVMGRTEPRGTTTEPRGTTTEPAHDDMWPDMSQVRMRFDQLQSDFIDEPRGAAQKAEQLMAETVDKVTRSMHDRMQRVHGDIANGADTEKLRLAMHNLKEMIDSMPGARRAA